LVDEVFFYTYYYVRFLILEQYLIHMFKYFA
jgi:hypothetical protein